MLAAIGAWFAGKSLKLLAIAAAALVIIGILLGGYFYVSGLSDDLAKSKADLAEQTMRTGMAEAREKGIKDQHTEQLGRIQTLEAARTTLNTEVETLRGAIADMDLEEDMKSDNANLAADNLNAAHARLNRLLEHASGNVRPADPAPAGKAGAPRRN